jgi:hypothetical protein
MNIDQFFFGRQSKIIKSLLILKRIFTKLYKIFPLLKKNKLNFILKIIKSEIFIEFQPEFENQKNFFKNYKFDYDDWFSSNFKVWKYYLTPLKEIKYLEIGSFEGRSAVFIGELDNVKEITCVDTFEGSDEHNDINFDLVFKNCSQNLKKLKIQNNLIKNTSHNFFKNNNKRFNVIYIDGSHFYDDVKKDFINSLNCLEENGILICDDFYWFFYEQIEQNPILAILQCYSDNEKDLEVLFINYQIIFKKRTKLTH